MKKLIKDPKHIRWRAWKRVHRAIKRTIEGKEKKHPLEPPYYLTCVDCGYSPCEYDHEWGYRWWWKVVPRCVTCHKARHRRVSKEKRTKKEPNHANLR
jgi:hypothetical protein